MNSLMYQAYMKKTSVSQPHIEVLAYIDNWLNQKVWYTYIIRLDEKYMKEDIDRMKEHLISHMPTIYSAKVK